MMLHIQYQGFIQDFFREGETPMHATLHVHMLVHSLGFHEILDIFKVKKCQIQL